MPTEIEIIHLPAPDQLKLYALLRASAKNKTADQAVALVRSKFGANISKKSIEEAFARAVRKAAHPTKLWGGRTHGYSEELDAVILSEAKKQLHGKNTVVQLYPIVEAVMLNGFRVTTGGIRTSLERQKGKKKIPSKVAYGYLVQKKKPESWTYRKIGKMAVKAAGENPYKKRTRAERFSKKPR